MRRSVAAILLAHQMDPGRRELYVEGKRDRLFLEWLVGDGRDLEANIIEIASVELPEVELGGERGRLMALGALVEGGSAQIRCFADADCDRVLGHTAPAPVWLTDGRDMEAYVLVDACVGKSLRIGLATDRVSAADVRDALRAVGRPLGLLRLYSERERLALPFKSVGLRRYLARHDDGLRWNRGAHVQSLLQTAGRSIREKREVLDTLATLEDDYSTTDEAQLIHGKDAFEIVAKVINLRGFSASDAGRLLWTSFEDTFIEPGATLGTVVEYLAGAP